MKHSNWQLQLIPNVGNCNWKKTGLCFSPVQSYVYFQSCRLDLRTLVVAAAAAAVVAVVVFVVVAGARTLPSPTYSHGSPMDSDGFR
jgi:hypothetical protein